MSHHRFEKMSAHDEKTPGGISTRFAASLPAAVGALLIASAVAFGGSTLASFRADAAASDAAEPIAADVKGGGITASKPTSALAGPLHDSFPQMPKQKKSDPTEPPAPEPTKEAPPAEPQPAKDSAPPQEVAKPQPAPIETEKPVEPAPPKPVVGALALEAWVKGDRVKLSWTPFWGEGFEYYKLVRSVDANVGWPLGGDDQLVGAIGHPEEAFFADKPPCGIWFHYAVFAVRGGANGYEVIAASNVAGGGVECAPAPPPTATIALQAAFADGKVNLAWQPCAADGFVAYKVVRSQTNTDPRYPAKEATEVIAAIGDPNVTGFTDGAVAAGQTWHYRVLVKADNGYGGFIACESPVVTVTIP